MSKHFVPVLSLMFIHLWRDYEVMFRFGCLHYSLALCIARGVATYNSGGVVLAAMLLTEPYGFHFIFITPTLEKKRGRDPGVHFFVWW